ncbi:protein kinase [Nevskia sp.]|uniref:protein kinase domain-containing protein n=1 Tax=Nevskia sp. TaxID=1929292 RepID=UPI0025F4CCA5|nr:protein kinase [Nevskia sp.]
MYRLLRESVGDKVCYVDLLDWNFDEAPWFVEAEYCPGGSLQEWFEAKGGIGKVPLATRLDLIAQIAEALAEIHLVGILHKDLKPANIFVVTDTDGRPAIRLADFGSSRLLDPNRLAALEITRMGFTQVIDADADGSSGTPLYLAPEVLAGHPATVKADIYALGVMLYQFAIGNLRRQLGAGWEVEIDDEMLREDIAAAAENNPVRRLANAAELALRLRALAARRQARLEALEAARKAEAAARAMDRMKARRLGMMVAFATMVVATVTSGGLYLEARQARDNAEKETARAKAVSRFFSETMIEPIDVGSRPMSSLTVKELLDSAAHMVPATFADHPIIEAELRASIGKAYKSLEFPEQSAEQLEDALAIYRRLHGDGSEPVASLAAQLVVNRFDQRKLAATLPELRGILAASVRQLGTENPTVVDLTIEIARGEALLGLWEDSSAHCIEVESDLRPQKEQRKTLARVLSLHAWNETSLGNTAVAAELASETLSIYRDLHGPEHIETLRAKLLVASVLIEGMKLDQAENMLDAIEQSAASWVRSDNVLPLWIRIDRARIAAQRGNTDAAVKLMTAVIADFNLQPSRIDESGRARQILGRINFEAGRDRQALVELQQAVKAYRTTVDEDHPELMSARLDIVEVLMKLDDQDSARIELENPVPIAFKRLPPQHVFQNRLQFARSGLGIGDSIKLGAATSFPSRAALSRISLISARTSSTSKAELAGPAPQVQ